MSVAMFWLIYFGIGLIFNIFVFMWIIRKAYIDYNMHNTISMESLLRDYFNKDGWIMVYVQTIWPIAIPVIIVNIIYLFLTFISKGAIPFLSKLLLKIYKNKNPENYV